MYSEVINTIALLVSILSLIGFAIVERDSLTKWFRKTFHKQAASHLPKEITERRETELSSQKISRTPLLSESQLSGSRQKITSIIGTILFSVVISLIAFSIMVVVKKVNGDDDNLLLALIFVIISFMPGVAIGYIQGTLVNDKSDERFAKSGIGCLAYIVILGIIELPFYCLDVVGFKSIYEYGESFSALLMVLAGAVTGLCVRNTRPDS